MRTILNFFISLWFYITFFFYYFGYGGLTLLIRKFIVKKYGEEAGVKYSRKVLHQFSHFVYDFLFSKVTVIGKENVPVEEGLVVIANHQSLFDIPAIYGYVVEAAFMSKIENLKIPIIGKYIKAIDSILIDRDNPTQGAAALMQLARKIKQKKNIAFFPEGTRTVDGNMGPFKEGALAIPYRYNAVILPVCVHNTIDIVKKKSLIVKPANVKVTVLKPVNPKDFASDKEMSDFIWNEMDKTIKGDRV